MMVARFVVLLPPCPEQIGAVDLWNEWWYLTRKFTYSFKMSLPSMIKSFAGGYFSFIHVDDLTCWNLNKILLLEI